MEDEEAASARLGERIRREGRYHTAPPHLAARILASLPAPGARVPRPEARRRWNPWAVASGFAVAAALAISVTAYLLAARSSDQFAEEMVAAHVRSLMVDHAFDIASSDSHTVKPWFAGKLDYSPRVVDLTSQGFPLVGGRLEYLDHRPVAALVYRHRQHLINVFVFRAERGVPLRPKEHHGFQFEAWSRDGMDWWAVSELNAQEMAQFRAALEKAPG